MPSPVEGAPVARDALAPAHKRRVRAHFDATADVFDRNQARNAYYHEYIRRFVRSAIPPGQRVLEVGCATGNLLAAVRPSFGVGLDLSERMLRIARREHPQLHFVCGDVEDAPLAGRFEYVLLSNLLDYVPDLQAFLRSLKRVLAPRNRIFVTTPNPLWEAPMALANRLGWRTLDTERNFVTNMDVKNLLEIEGFRVIQEGHRLLLPKRIPIVSDVVNLLLTRLPVVQRLAFMQYMVAQLPEPPATRRKLTTTVVIPCKNEVENVDECIARVPPMGAGVEIVVVDDGSDDGTADAVRRVAATRSDVRLVSYQPNRGKGHAVKVGFEAATGDVLMILDADMTVRPEDLPRFHDAIESGAAEFVNGTRMIYPMETGAMRSLNFVGNKGFGILISLIIGQRSTDTLCGTKAIRRDDFRHVSMDDPSWGDFDLLFGAAKLKLHMVEMPIRYKARVAGQSKMKALAHGWRLAKVCWRGLTILP